MAEPGMNGFEVDASTVELRRLRVAKSVHLEVWEADRVAVPLLLRGAPLTLEVAGGGSSSYPCRCSRRASLRSAHARTPRSRGSCR